MKSAFSRLTLFVFIVIFICAGCGSTRPVARKSQAKKTGMPKGPVRLTTILRVAEDYKQYITRITDEAEKYRINGYIWEHDTQRMRFVLEGERDKVNELFDRVIEIGRVCGKLANYDIPKWSDATGKFERFVWVFGDKPPE